MRAPASRGSVSAAAALPATLLVAIFVAAPFAGTTTAPLAAASRPVAVSAAAPTADARPTPGVPAQESTTTDSGATATGAHGAVKGAVNPVPLQMPRTGLRTLVLWYLGLGVVAVAVLAAVAAGALRRDE